MRLCNLRASYTYVRSLTTSSTFRQPTHNNKQSAATMVGKDPIKQDNHSVGGVSSSSPENDAAVAAKIRRLQNPADSDDQHNFGQPLVPQIDASGKQRSKFLTDCKKEHKASLDCIMDNYEDRGVCQPFFDSYKECRKEEQKRRLERNARMSGGGEDGGACTIM